jgi:tRNA(fMet)-specific endonuclease VapC
MSNYLLDTNVLLLAIRSEKNWNATRQSLKLDQSANFISVVTLGELWSLSYQNNWGDRRISEMEKLLQQFVIVDINFEIIIRRYAEIDAFSQNKLKGKPLGMSSRNMGKNDLWIAATASVLNLTLLTTDQDFTHLSPDFLQMKQI